MTSGQAEEGGGICFAVCLAPQGWKAIILLFWAIYRERVPRPLFEWSVRATSPSLAWPNVSPYFKFCQTSHVNPQTAHPLPAEQKMYFIWNAFIHHCSLHCYNVKMANTILIFFFLFECIWCGVFLWYWSTQDISMTLTIFSQCYDTPYHSSLFVQIVCINICTVQPVVEVMAGFSGRLRVEFTTLIYWAVPSTSFQMELFPPQWVS